ncbi:MAG: NUDIX hydrolase [Sebaldella sp.]|nr:NUDIX hydrolase [Sebaldella sp.]
MENNRPRVRVAGILIEDDRVLLIEHTKNDRSYWLLPGGGVDWGESIEEAIKREFLEETNLTVEIENFLFISETLAPDNTKHVINLYFRVKRISGDMLLGEESILSDLKFFTLEEIEKIKIYPNINDILKKIMKKESYKDFLGMIWDK